MNGFSHDLAGDELQRSIISAWEIDRLNKFIDIVKMRKDDAGNALNIDDLLGMTERALEALKVHGRFGLSARELCQKRELYHGIGAFNLYLDFPFERQREISLKSVAMLLYRLKRNGLADRQKEGHEFRYFISKSGFNRLVYYTKMREKTRQQRKREQSVNHSLELLWPEYNANGKLVERLTDVNRNIGSSFRSHVRDPSISQVYSPLWSRIEELVNVIHFFQLSILTGNHETHIVAFQKGTESLINLERTIGLLFASLQVCEPTKTTKA